MKILLIWEACVEQIAYSIYLTQPKEQTRYETVLNFVNKIAVLANEVLIRAY